MGDRERAGATGALYSFQRGVLGDLLDAAAWIRDGIAGPGRGRRRAKKKDASMRGHWQGKKAGVQYSQSMTKLPSGWGAGVGTWCE